eukprot:g19926.t1
MIMMRIRMLTNTKSEAIMIARPVLLYSCSQKPSSFVEFHFHNPFTKTVDDKKWTDQQDGSALDAVKGGHWKYMRIFTPPSTQRPISMYAKDLEHFLGRCQYWFGRGQKTDAGNAADLEACQQYHLRLGEPHDGIFAFF